jgi:hypothetical protein
VALSSATSGGRLIVIVRSPTQSTEFVRRYIYAAREPVGLHKFSNAVKSGISAEPYCSYLSREFDSPRIHESEEAFGVLWDVL